MKYLQIAGILVTYESIAPSGKMITIILQTFPWYDVIIILRVMFCQMDGEDKKNINLRNRTQRPHSFNDLKIFVDLPGPAHNQFTQPTKVVRQMISDFFILTYMESAECNTARPERSSRRYFAVGIFKRIFLNKNV